jgi:hypothetical protein
MFLALADRLSIDERARRTPGTFVHPLDNELAGLINKRITLIERLLIEYPTRWGIDRAILIANLNRIFNVLPQLTLTSFVVRLRSLEAVEFSVKEWLVMLEFYLQMDSE